MVSDLTEPIDAHRRDTALWLTLNRPSALNGIDDALVAALDHALDEAETAADIRSVVITAVGSVFCAGADLKLIRTMADRSPADAARMQRDYLARVGRLYDRIEQFRKPVIAAVDGVALAGGLELILCCDFVIATTASRFGDAHANFGLLPGGGGSVRLPRRVGPAYARYLMFTGRQVTATDIAHTDLIAHLADSRKGLEDAVDTITADIAAKSPLGLQVMKRLVNDGLDESSEAARATELRAIAHHALSEDFAEGLKAFGDKRTPSFVGR